jgi:two-component system sensor histidine kinase BarA
MRRVARRSQRSQTTKGLPVSAAPPLPTRRRSPRPTLEDTTARMSAVISLAQTLAQYPPLGDCLEEVCRAVVRLLGCSRASIFLREGSSYVLHSRIGADFRPTPPAAIEIPMADETLARAFDGHRVARIQNLARSRFKHLTAAFPPSLHSIALTPLLDEQGHVTGLLTAEYDRIGVVWSGSRPRNLLQLAGLASTAVSRARRESRRGHEEEVLGQSERRFRALIENSSDAVVLLRPDGEILYAGPAVIRTWGYTPEELVGLNGFDLLPARYRMPARSLMADLLTSPGGTRTAEYRVKQKDGSWRWMEGVGTNLMHDPTVAAIVINSRDITDRKLAEAALRRSEERFRTMIENALDIVTIVDQDGVIRYESPSVEKLLGFRPEELVGKSAFEFVHPDDLSGVLEIFAGSLSNSGPTPAAEARFRHKDGSWRVLEGVSLNLMDRAGVGGMVINARDVTERRRADRERAVLLEIARDIGGSLELEEILAKVHQRTTELLPCDAVATYYWDPTGLTAQLVGHHGLPPEVAPLATSPRLEPNAALVELLAGGRTLVIQNAADQQWLPADMLSRFEVTAMVVVPLVVHARRLGALVALSRTANRGFDDRQVQLLEGIAQQVAVAIETTELYREAQSEAQVFAALAHVGRQLISSLTTPALLERLCRLTTEVIGCDCSHTLLWRPDEEAYVAVSGFGYSAEVWESIRVLKFPAPMLADALARLAREEVLNLNLEAFAHNPLAAFGTQQRITQALGVALRRGGELIGLLVGAYRDRREPFTPQQERLARGVAQLASLALENARLVEELADANRLKSEFVAAMSHELRTPLNIILGYISLLLEQAFGPLAGEQLEILHRVSKSTEDLLELVTTTLDLSRLQAGRLQVELQDCDAGDLVTELDAETRHLRRKSEVRFVWRVASDLPRLHTDPLKLKVVLKNLVANAAKFTDRGLITVEATAHDGGVRFHVSDTGVGMQPEILSAIFEPFRQFHGEIGRGRGGVGLGLHISRRLVDMLGGTIEVESEVGRGSTFRVWVPTVDQSDHQLDPP